MRKIKLTSKYQTVSLPEPFYNEIKEHIKQNPRYRSIAEFVKESIRFNMRYEKSPMNKGTIFGTSGIDTDPFGTNETEAKFPVTDEVKRYIEDEVKAIFEKTLKEQKKKKAETNGNGHGFK